LALVQQQASSRLRGVARDYWGYAEWTGEPLRRRELPSAGIVFIVNLGAPLLVAQPRSAALVVLPGGGFVAGLHETYTLTETAGSQSGIELRLSPLGAYRLLGQPMHTLANRTVALDELCGPWAIDLAERLLEASTWDARFAALDDALAARLTHARAPSPEIAWAWRQLAGSGGRIPIATLGEELGWSPKRLIARFREQIGLPPKQVARLLRFQRATSLLADAESPDWGALARHCGYYDQSHLIHEFQRFAGDTPDGLTRRRLATGGGFAAD
jgi:AraC-like DNA-binding protein